MKMNPFPVWLLVLLAFVIVAASCQTGDPARVQDHNKTTPPEVKVDNPDKPDQAAYEDAPADATPPVEYSSDGGIDYSVPNAFTSGHYEIRCIYQNVDFALKHQFPMYPVTTDQLPWSKNFTPNKDNGPFITYMFSHKQMSLGSPQARVEYINRKLPGCSTADSIYHWLDNQLGLIPGSLVLKETFKVEVASGQPAYCREYFRARSQLSEKYMAYAYIAYDENYMIGFNLTTLDESEYKEHLPKFYDLVKSMKIY